MDPSGLYPNNVLMSDGPNPLNASDTSLEDDDEEVDSGLSEDSRKVENLKKEKEIADRGRQEHWYLYGTTIMVLGEIFAHDAMTDTFVFMELHEYLSSQVGLPEKTAEWLNANFNEYTERFIDASQPAKAGTIDSRTGIKYDSMGFPIFDSKFEVWLDPVQFTDSSRDQFKYCRDKLYEVFDEAPDPYRVGRRFGFTQSQVDDVLSHKTPNGYTWHHN